MMMKELVAFLFLIACFNVADCGIPTMPRKAEKMNNVETTTLVGKFDVDGRGDKEVKLEPGSHDEQLPTAEATNLIGKLGVDERGDNVSIPSRPDNVQRVPAAAPQTTTHIPSMFKNPTKSSTMAVAAGVKNASREIIITPDGRYITREQYDKSYHHQDNASTKNSSDVPAVGNSTAFSATAHGLYEIGSTSPSSTATSFGRLGFSMVQIMVILVVCIL